MNHTTLLGRILCALPPLGALLLCGLVAAGCDQAFHPAGGRAPDGPAQRDTLRLEHAGTPDSDAPTTFVLTLADGQQIGGIREVYETPAARFAVTATDTLLRIDAHGVAAILEGVLPGAAVLADGVVVSRFDPAEGPGQSDLYRVFADGRVVPLVVGPGPDNLPLVLDDGRLVFVSGRTTVASLFIKDLTTGDERQLTNVGLAAGRTLDGFVPPPARHLLADGSVISWDTGRGERLHLDVDGNGQPPGPEVRR